MLPSGQCPRCGTDDHPRRIDGIDDKHYGFCRGCAYAVRRQPEGKKLTHGDAERTCYLCRRTMDTANFTKRSSGSYFSACKECNKWSLSARSRAKKRASK